MGGGGDGSSGVVLGKVDDHEVGEIAGFFELAEVFEEDIHAELIGDVHVPAGRIKVRVAAKVGDADVIGEFERFAGFVLFEDFLAGHFRIGFGVVHFAIVAERESGGKDAIPDESRT